MQTIRKAVIPVAGYGTRFLPATKAQPKEMLPLIDKPVIQFIVEEFVAAGIEEIVLVTSSNKRAIEDHFDRSFELESRLEKDGKLEKLKAAIHSAKLAKFIYVRQPEMLGNGHALLMAKEVIGDIKVDPAVAVVIPPGSRKPEPVAGQSRALAYLGEHASVIAIEAIGLTGIDGVERAVVLQNGAHFVPV